MKCTADSAASSLATDLKTLEKKEIHTLMRIGGTESCLCHFDSFPIVTIHHDLGYNLYYILLYLQKTKWYLAILLIESEKCMY